MLGESGIRPNPYRGIYPFREKDRDHFFGRSEVVQLLLERTADHSLTVVLGPSGSGKSSLLHAGLVPLLHDSGSYLIVTMRPRKDPMQSLAAEVARAANECGANWDADPANILNLLRSGSVVDVAEKLLEKTGRKEFVLIVDQLEELFALCPDEALRDLFTETVVAPFMKPMLSERVACLLGLRSDFTEAVAKLPALARAVDKHSVVIAPLNDEQLREAVSLPASMSGVEISPAVVDRVVADFRDEANSLPLLEFTLERLWEAQQDGRIDMRAYEALGGVRGALTQYADKCLEDFDEDERTRARRIFLQCVGSTPETKDVRQPIHESDLRDGDWGVVEMLGEDRLLSIDQDERGQFAELAHEALSRDWQQLRDWIATSIEDLAAADRKADEIVGRYSLVAGALNLAPPGFDLLLVGLAFARMGERMAKAYDVSITRDLLKTSGVAMAEGIAAVSGGVWAGNTLLKSIPGVGIGVALLIQPPIVAALAFAVGTTWKYFFHRICQNGKGPDNAELKELVSINFRNRIRHLKKVGKKGEQSPQTVVTSGVV